MPARSHGGDARWSSRRGTRRTGSPDRNRLGRLPGVGLVVVVDDGSRDATAAVAQRAGAAVMRHPGNGQGSAMETGAEATRLVDQREDRDTSAICCSSTRTSVTPQAKPGR